jgi:hypothetical protein
MWSCELGSWDSPFFTGKLGFVALEMEFTPAILQLGKGFGKSMVTGILTRAATLDNLFSPRTGTEIPYVPLQHNMQFSPMFPYVPLQILYFPYKYCIFVWKIHCRKNFFGHNTKFPDITKFPTKFTQFLTKLS